MFFSCLVFYVTFQTIPLYDAMFTALVQDRVDFVQLFMENGVNLKNFLSIATLWNLYGNVSSMLVSYTCIYKYGSMKNSIWRLDMTLSFIFYLINCHSQKVCTFGLSRFWSDLENILLLVKKENEFVKFRQYWSVV